MANHSYEFGPFRFDAARQSLLREDEPVRLKAKACELLQALIESRGQLLKKDELMGRLWPDTVVEENNLTVHMAALRKALGDSPDAHRYIVTVPGQGYRFVAEVRELAEAELIMRKRVSTSLTVEEEVERESDAAMQRPEEAERETPSVSSSPTRLLAGSPRRRLWRWLAVAACAVALALGAAAAWLWLMLREPPSPYATAANSVAVLPFKSLGAEGGDEYLGLGVADVLITRLSGLRRVVVPPTSTVRRYATRERDPVSAGRELGVKAVLDGSIQKSGGQIRVTVRLLSVPDGRPLWADQFDEPLADGFTLQDKLAGQVAEALALRLTGEERERLARRDTANPEAYELYLRGRFYSNKFTGEAVSKGIACFQQAVALDPAYALAYAGLADAYCISSDWQRPPSEVVPKARAAAAKAVELDDNLVEGYAALGHASLHDWDWAAAERAFRRALEINPNYAATHKWYGEFLVTRMRFLEAMREVQLAHALDPLSPETSTILGQAYAATGRADRAIELLRQVLEMDPQYTYAHLVLGQIYGERGEGERAVAAFNEARRFDDNPVILSSLAVTHGLAGRRGEVEKLLAEMQQLSRRRYVSPYSLATVYAVLGEKEQALDCLQQAYESRSLELIYLKFAPLPWFDGVRAEPRFKALVGRLE
jgi:DNA-binding winged helix-turn-helix (wHTH) protein/TolB-like protein/Flp pilus assembly protein TadD